jgi:co-chaperonin GroES (HSP10)
MATKFTNDRILVHRVEEEATTRGGILIPSAKASRRRAKSSPLARAGAMKTARCSLWR